jgi:hypothetical protein
MSNKEWFIRPGADYSAEFIQDMQDEFPFSDGVPVIRKDIYLDLYLKWAQASVFLETIVGNSQHDHSVIPEEYVNKIRKFLEEVNRV